MKGQKYRRSYSRSSGFGRLPSDGAGYRQDSETGAQDPEAVRLTHVLNGQIHQVLRKVEGKVTFHTARRLRSRSRNTERGLRGPSRDGRAAKLQSGLGCTAVLSYGEDCRSLAIVDSPRLNNGSMV